MKVYHGVDGLQKYYTISDVARAIGVSAQYLHRRISFWQDFPFPTHTLGKREYYTHEEFYNVISREAERRELIRAAKLKSKKDGGKNAKRK